MSRNIVLRCARLTVSFALITATGVIAQSTPPSLAPSSVANSTVVLSPFEVSTGKDYGYRKLNTITTSRIGVSILEAPQAIEVISGELLSDFRITSADSVFRYTSSVLAGESEIAQANRFVSRGFELPRYFNGVRITEPGAVQPFLPVDNVERVEIAKGPVGLFYGNSTPNGVANYVTKRPQFKTATDVELTGGTYAFRKASLDSQGVIGTEGKAAYRVVAATQRGEGRINHQENSYTFVAPSIVIRPWKNIEVNAEYNATTFRQTFPSTAQTWNYFINPQYWQDVTNPSQDLLNKIKSTFSLATDDLARARIQTRWVVPSFQTYLLNWSADYLTMFGTEPFLGTGTKVDWWRFSGEGDKFSGLHPDSYLGGVDRIADLGLTITPAENLAVRARFVRMESRESFVRALFSPNGGLRPDGRITSFTAISGFTVIPDDLRRATNETRQLDVTYAVKVAGLKNTFGAGFEQRRAKNSLAQSPVDFTRAAPRTDRFGTTLTGANVYQFYDPFLHPIPSINAVVSGMPVPVATGIPSVADEYYLSHRGSGLDNRVNTVVGSRYVKSNVKDKGAFTHSFGAIWEALPGIHAFATYSTTVIITNALSVTGLGALPNEGKLLDNEKGKGYEVGFKSSWRDSTLSGTVSLFNVERNGIVAGIAELNNTDPRNLDTNPNNNVNYNGNLGRQLAEGVDVDLIWTPNRSLQAIINAQYEWDAKVLSDPSLNPRVRNRAYIKAFERRRVKSPLWQSNLVVKYNVLQGAAKGAAIGGAIRFKDRYMVSATSFFDLHVPPETMVDLFATYRTTVFRTPTSLQLNLSNVTNQINDITRDLGFQAALSAKFSF